MKKLLLLLKKPKLRHGALSVVLIIALITALVLINLAVTSLEESYGWRKDYSFNEYLTTGEETKEVLSMLQNDVTIYMLYASGEPDQTLLELLKSYQRLSDRIKVEPTDLNKNPGVLSRFDGSLSSVVSSDSVIVSCEATGRYEVLNSADFIQRGYNIEAGTFEIAGLRYEKSVTEAILFVTQSKVPTIGILQGHGELDAGVLTNLTGFIKQNGYAWEMLTLKAGGKVENVDMIAILSPVYDITTDELNQLSAFAENGGCFLFTRDFDDPMELSNLFSLLRNYSVIPKAGIVVASEQDENSYDGELIYLRPTMQSVDFTLPLVAGDMTALTMPGASCFETPETTDNQLAAASVLLSGKHSYLRDPSDGVSSIDQQSGDPVGPFTVGLYAQRMHANTALSRMFALGCSATITQDYMYEHTYAQLFILQVLGALLPQKSISLDIAQTAAFHPGLMVGSQTLGLILIILMPLAVLVAALCILIPRKNR